MRSAAEPRLLLHYDAFTALKTHLVAKNTLPLVLKIAPPAQKKLYPFSVVISERRRPCKLYLVTGLRCSGISRGAKTYHLWLTCGPQVVAPGVDQVQNAGR